MLNDLCGARKCIPLGSSSKPITHLAYATFRLASMRPDILAGDVGNERAISVGLPIENQGPFLALIVRAKPLAAKKQPEFEGHIESRQPGGSIQLDRREVVNSEPAFLDNPLDFR